MSVDAQRLKSHLAAIVDGMIPAPDLSSLIHDSREIVLMHLRSKNLAVSTLCAHHGITMADLAMDCLGEVFIDGREGRHVKIHRFSESLGRRFADVGPGEIFVAWRGFLIKVADAHLGRLYALADPEGGRIYRNIRESVRKSDLFTLRKTPGGNILYAAGCESSRAGRIFPPEDLERACLPRSSGIRTTSDYLRVLHDILTAGADGDRGILLYDAVKLMKRLYVDGTAEIPFQAPFDLDEFTSDDIERIKDAVKACVKERMVHTYIIPGKLSRREAEQLYLAVEDILEDWCEGGTADRTLHGYLKVRMPVDAEEYARRYKSKLEYLVKLARVECESWLLRDL